MKRKKAKHFTFLITQKLAREMRKDEAQEEEEEEEKKKEEEQSGGAKTEAESGKQKGDGG